jgi:ArsR family transcriptional regulator
MAECLTRTCCGRWPTRSGWRSWSGLRDPTAHFPPQRDGDLERDGVCSLFIAEKLGVSQPTCGEHLKVLTRAGLIRGTKIKQWVFYQRDERAIAQARKTLGGNW